MALLHEEEDYHNHEDKKKEHGVEDKYCRNLKRQITLVSP